MKNKKSQKSDEFIDAILIAFFLITGISFLLALVTNVWGLFFIPFFFNAFTCHVLFLAYIIGVSIIDSK